MIQHGTMPFTVLCHPRYDVCPRMIQICPPCMSPMPPCLPPTMCIGPGSAELWSRTLVHLLFPSFIFSTLPLGAPLHSFLRVGVGGDAYSPRPRCASVVGVGVAARLGSLSPTSPLLLWFQFYISKYRPPNSSHRTVFQFQPPSIAPAPAQVSIFLAVFLLVPNFLFLAPISSFRSQLLPNPSLPGIVAIHCTY
ncbi:uncharacterized protein SCHCODRAFT_02501935 [Schizophyllum commune H4-8]|uniref:Expressed protein n=1 Tax=Schizophyllum commune (strain H4-8 / FGSC 9210) TaxID=578458 RepID=D8Q4J1_SCHCM|nr:uncharacterized protein SCHCODRAFT_02501935 [Schizophyllum commune H4-8]KAI5892594.1 hypothetical protein SCHCODRAFT_02501935 [Schizophyllum commune H4-8]